MVIQTCRLCPCIQASRRMPASCLPLPTPAPSPIMNPAIVHRRFAENQDVQCQFIGSQQQLVTC